ncbi:hypothetical protein T484DRAFT_2376502 [Baffinella frigidus]|nr:hypothetical protein T484DRAFT_2376502 [Cryptophyta sp. CCMP2293]
MLGNITRKLDEVLDAKNKAIKDLQYELARVTKAHNDVISVYNAKLAEFGIPVDELGFKPLHALTTTAPGAGGRERGVFDCEAGLTTTAPASPSTSWASSPSTPSPPPRRPGSSSPRPASGPPEPVALWWS